MQKQVQVSSSVNFFNAIHFYLNIFFLYFGPFIPRDEPFSLWWEMAEAKMKK